MPTQRKEIPVVGAGRDGATYAAFITGLCTGSIHATALVETTVPDGTRDVHVPQFVENGPPLPDVIVTVPKRRLIKFEYDDPNG